MYLLRPAFEEPFNKNVKIWCGSAAKPMGYLKPKTKRQKEGFGIGFGMDYSLWTLSFVSTQDMSSSQQSIYYYDHGNHKQYMYQIAYAR